MYSRRNNLSQYSGHSGDGRNYYFGDTASPTAVVGMSQRLPDRAAFSTAFQAPDVGRPGLYEGQPYISSADVHVSPESITVTPGRKTITIGRKEPHQFTVSPSYPYRSGAFGDAGPDDGDPRSVRRPDMVYKTTMITQVLPRDGSCGRDSPQMQHARSDSRLYHVSVEPTSPQGRPEYIGYSPSPERSMPRRSQSGGDWPSFSPQALGQTHYLPCSPDRMVEISFQHPVLSQQAKHHYQQDQPQQIWRGHDPADSMMDSPQGHRAWPSGSPQPEPQAVPSRLVYSPQTPNQSIAYSKKVEKKTPSHCSSITIVPGAKRTPDDEGHCQNSEAVRLMDQRAGPPHGPNDDREAEIDELTNLLVQNMQMTGDPEFFGMCTSCSRAIMGSQNGCSALGRLYHVTCFVCGVCRMPLKQKPFFSLDGVTFCERCYATTVERCSECNEPITEKMLRAVGKQYHPGCFKCSSCRESLDGRAFTLDASGLVFCLEDFNRRYAPRCSGCGEMIIPLEGRGEAERVVVLDRNYHLECHRCEDCGKLLSSRFGGDGCFPLDDSVLCGRCNARRMERLTNPSSTKV